MPWERVFCLRCKKNRRICPCGPFRKFVELEPTAMEPVTVTKREDLDLRLGTINKKPILQDLLNKEFERHAILKERDRQRLDEISANLKKIPEGEEVDLKTREEIKGFFEAVLKKRRKCDDEFVPPTEQAMKEKFQFERERLFKRMIVMGKDRGVVKEMPEGMKVKKEAEEEKRPNGGEKENVTERKSNDTNNNKDKLVKTEKDVGIHNESRDEANTQTESKPKEKVGGIVIEERGTSLNEDDDSEIQKGHVNHSAVTEEAVREKEEVVENVGEEKRESIAEVREEEEAVENVGEENRESIAEVDDKGLESISDESDENWVIMLSEKQKSMYFIYEFILIYFGSVHV